MLTCKFKSCDLEGAFYCSEVRDDDLPVSYGSIEEIRADGFIGVCVFEYTATVYSCAFYACTGKEFPPLPCGFCICYVYGFRVEGEATASEAGDCSEGSKAVFIDLEKEIFSCAEGFCCETRDIESGSGGGTCQARAKQTVRAKFS